MIDFLKLFGLSLLHLVDFVKIIPLPHYRDVLHLNFNHLTPPPVHLQIDHYNHYQNHHLYHPPSLICFILDFPPSFKEFVLSSYLRYHNHDYHNVHIGYSHFH